MLDRFHKISEIVAAFAIVGSLIFVGIQVNQNTDAIRVSFIQSAMESWNTHAMAMATDEDLSEAFFNSVHPELIDKFDLTFNTTDGRLGMWISATFRTIETLFLEWQAGNLPDDVWHGYRAGMVRSFAFNRAFSDEWQANRDQFTPAFRAYGDALLKEGAEARLQLLASN